MFLAKNQNDGKVNYFFISGNEVKRKREDGRMNYPAFPAQTLKRSSINGVVFLFKRCAVFVKYVLMFFCLVIAYSLKLTSIRVIIKRKRIEVELLAYYDADANILKFEAATEMVANTPYIIKCSKESTPFEALADVAVAASATFSSPQLFAFVVTSSSPSSRLLLPLKSL